MEDLKKRYFSKESPDEAKDSFDYEIDRIKERALLSPFVAQKETSERNMLDYVTRHPLGAYTGTVALVVAFGDCAQGSFYPEWVLQSSVFAGEETKPLRLKALQKRHVDHLIDICNRIVESCEMSEDERNVKMQRSAVQFEWRLPLSENEIAEMDEVFRSLIRRKE